MGIDTMGKVLVTAKVENLKDLYLAEPGTISPSDFRQVEITDALIETGATAFSMPKRLIEELGRTPGRVRQALTSGGIMCSVSERSTSSDGIAYVALKTISLCSSRMAGRNLVRARWCDDRGMLSNSARA